MSAGFPDRAGDRKTIWAWSLYDWANSSFTTLILTFVFSTYFTQAVAEDATKGAAQWGYAMSVSGLLLLILGPVMAAIADHTGRLKIWIFVTTSVCILGTALLGFAAPHSDGGMVLLILCAVMLANVGFELGIIFYNALLPNVAPRAQWGRVSSFAWALGYMGGLISLIVMLLLFIGAGDIGPFIQLPKEDAWHIRIVIPLVVGWIALFSLPLFFFVPDNKGTGLTIKCALQQGIQSLKYSFRKLRGDIEWRHFLIGSALYRDGLNTLFAIGGIFAAQQYGLTTSQIMLFGIGMNVTAGIGCFATSFFEDRYGSFHVVRISLVGLVICGTLVLATSTATYFLIFALLMGLYVGPVQSASRTLVSRLSPADAVTENYGLYALTGRAAAFLGPFCYATATLIFDSQKAGMASIIMFWLVGLLFVARLKEPA